MGALTWAPVPSQPLTSVLGSELPLCTRATPSSTHSVFINVLSWAKDSSRFQLNKQFPWHVKPSSVLIGIPPPPHCHLCAVGGTKKWPYYLAYYRHGTVIYGVCLVKCHVENIYSPLTVPQGGGEGEGLRRGKQLFHP